LTSEDSLDHYNLVPYDPGNNQTIHNYFLIFFLLFIFIFIFILIFNIYYFYFKILGTFGIAFQAQLKGQAGAEKMVIKTVKVKIK